MKKLLPILLLFIAPMAISQPGLEWGAPQVGTGTSGASTSFSMYEDPSGNIYTVGRFSGTIDFDPGPGVNNVTSATSLDVYVSKKDATGNLVWIKNFGSSDVTVNEITGDNSGNIYLSGEFQSTQDFDPGLGTAFMSSNGFQDAYILKLDASGNYLWAKSLGASSFDRAKAIHFDEINNQLLVVGDFNGTVDFDPSAAAYNLTSNSTDAFLLSLNSLGNFQWVKQFGGNSAEYLEGVVVDGAGSIYITGHFMGDIDVDPGVGFQGLTSLGSFDAFACKLNFNGDYLWANQLGGTGNDKSWDIDVDFDGSVIFTGEFANTVSYTDVNMNIFNITSNGSIDMFTCKLNNTGDILWVTAIGGAGNDRALSVIGRNGIVYIGGYYSDGADFDPSPAVETLSVTGAGTNACLYSLNNNGAYLWAYSFGNSGGALNTDEIFDVHVDDQNAVFATGYFYGTTPTVDIDPGPGMFNVQGTLDSHNAFTIKLACTQTTGTDNVTGSCPYTWIDGNTYYSDNNTATWTLSSLYGCDSVVTLNLTISDLTAPVGDAGSLSNITDECSVNSLTAPTATDNCAGTITGTHNATLPISAQGTTVVTWTYDDGNGNTSTQTQNVIIDDVTAPIADIGSLSNVTSECSVSSLTAPTATDNCAGTITGTHNATLPITSQGTTVVTWTYNDGNGNTSTQTQNVIIDDVTAPIANVGALSDITSECSVSSLTAPTATDNCAGTITGTHNATLPITTQGTTVVTWTYDDGNGNTSTQNQNVVIDDVTAPIADIGSLSNVTSECSVTSLTAPTATDNCVGTITGTHNASLPIVAQGTTVVTWTYDDGNGNTSTQTQDVIIDDVTAPIADIVTLSDITSECDVTPTAPTATDNCLGSLTGTPDVAFPITAAGTTTVTWTYDDGNGNTSTQTQDVIITPIDNGITQVDALTLSADANGYNYQWVDCDNGNQAINGATNQTFVATVNGNYAVEIDNGTCTVVSACLVIDEVGIKEIWEAELFDVYPNPTTGIVYIESKVKIESIELVDALGQIINVYSANENKIEIKSAPGVYFLRIRAEGSENIIRVVKQ